MKKLAEHNREKVVDVLCERLAFEREGVKLYDRILAVMRASNDEDCRRMLDQMEEHREEEKEHEEWLEDCVRALGADDKAQTERSRLVARESAGIEEVVMTETALPRLFHALLAAELVDNAGWDLLVQLATEAGDRDAKRAFKRRLREEEEHLLFVRAALERFARREVLGEALRMPAGGNGLFAG